MELMLNLVWATTALAMLVAWLRMPRHEHASRTRQILCLGIALLLLLPVISLSDDLVAAQTTTEMDGCVRRAHEAHAHPPHLCTASCTQAATAPFAFELPSRWEFLPLPHEFRSAHSASVQLPFSRPPPAA